MADQCDQGNENLNSTKAQEETKDRGGLFSFFGKKEEEKPKEEKLQDDAIMADHQEHHKPTLMEKLHPTKSNSSSSSSSSEEEVEEGGVKIRRKKNKKGLKEKIKAKISTDKKKPEIANNDAPVIPVEPYNEPVEAPSSAGEEKKGLLDKLKEKIPGHGHHKDAEGGGHPPPAEGEKKGIMEKIKEKLPGGAHKDHAEELKKEH
ncbi:hypothetical protein V2J09_015545 [Rumex salicifolius]